MKGTIKYLDHSAQAQQQSLRPVVEKLDEIKKIILEANDSAPVINVETKVPHVEVNVPAAKVEVHAQPAVPSITVESCSEIIEKSLSWPKLIFCVGVPTLAFLCDIVTRIVLNK